MQTPISGVQVTALNDIAASAASTDFSGQFKMRLRAGISQEITLQFRHPDYQPLDATWPSGEFLYVVRMKRLPARIAAEGQDVSIRNISIRYSVGTSTLANIGSGTQVFEVHNRGNRPCEFGKPCSPDGNWAATIGSAQLDAGEGNEFFNGRVSCIAGPCAFTKIQSDKFSKPARRISVSILNWSDTTTFLLQADVFRQELGDIVRSYPPVILGQVLYFSLPEAAQGPCIEADLSGEHIVFPLGPRPILSWSECDVHVGKDRAREYRCELKPHYNFK